MKLQITINGKVYEADVEVIDDDESQQAPAYVPYQPAPPPPHPMQYPGAFVQTHAFEASADEETVCRSPVTGLVIKVNVEAGQIVQPSELIMVLEAMKMETNVTAGHERTVKSVNVAPGDSVKVGQILIEYE